MSIRLLNQFGYPKLKNKGSSHKISWKIHTKNKNKRIYTARTQRKRIEEPNRKIKNKYGCREKLKRLKRCKCMSTLVQMNGK